MNKNERQSNFELMRIISMLFIIIWHVIMFGHILENCSNHIVKLAFLFIEYIVVVHVNSYVLVTGYFQVNSRFKSSKVFSIMNAEWFYKATIFILLLLFNLIHPSQIEMFDNIFYLDTGQYWFINTYIMLYLISPFLNKLINVLDKKIYIKLILVFFIIFSILPFITGNKSFANNGSTLYNFIFLYFIGAYLKKFPINEISLLKKNSKSLLRIILIIIFVFSAILNFLIFEFSTITLNLESNLISSFSNNMIYVSLHFNNPIIIVQSIIYFLFFETISFKSNIVNKISGLTFGIYLIHMNLYLKDFIYKWLKIDNGPIYSYKFLFYSIFISIVIFIICALIEYLRQLLFKFIYNRKISIKIRNKFYNFTKSLKFNN